MMLMRLLILLRGMIGARMARASYLAALRQIRPLESALRRLIVLAARDVRVTLGPSLPFPEALKTRPSQRANSTAFALFDPRLHPARPKGRSAKGLRISLADEAYPDPAQVRREVPDMIEADALLRRLERCEKALHNLNGAAKRLARWRAKHPTDRRRPMRPGRPPGYRRRGDAVDALLKELQELALYSYVPDTS